MRRNYTLLLVGFLSTFSVLAGEKITNNSALIGKEKKVEALNVFKYPQASIQLGDINPSHAKYEAGKLLFEVGQENEISIKSVRFFSNGAEVGRAKSAPFEIAWYPSAKGTYYVSAIVEGQNGLQAFTNVIKLNISPEHVGSESAEMNIFPVPTKNRTYVNLKDTWSATSGEFYLVDMNGVILGQHALQPNVHLYSFDTSELDEESYQIVFDDGLEESVFVIK